MNLTMHKMNGTETIYGVTSFHLSSYGGVIKFSRLVKHKGKLIEVPCTSNIAYLYPEIVRITVS